jgi:serine/threonine protein kinase
LADIGLVVRLDETISFLCTPDYMAPEAQSSPLADIYALGKVLYEAATGSHPSNFPAFPTAFPSRADRRELHQFMTLINKACENDPKDRYQSCDQLRDDLIDLRNALGNLRGAVGLHTPPTDLELPPEARP